MLTIIPTPIGNLKDITLRALEVLKECDAVICEDTRRTGLLLQHFEIKKPMLVLNDFNEFKNTGNIIGRLQNNEHLALVSDAGTPVISDPGFKLIREAIKNGLEIDSLPGASSITTALTLSGLPPDKFMFLGYFPDKPGHREKVYQNLKTINEIIPTTFISFIAPFKLKKTFEEMQSNLGDIEVVLAKELTKMHQKVDKKPISSWLETFKKGDPKGEFVALFNLSAKT